MRILALACALLLTGCASGPLALFFSSVSAIGTGVGIYQRYEDRQVQKEHVERLKAVEDAIKANTEEQKKIQGLLERLAPSPTPVSSSTPAPTPTPSPMPTSPPTPPSPQATP